MIAFEQVLTRVEEDDQDRRVSRAGGVLYASEVQGPATGSPAQADAAYRRHLSAVPEVGLEPPVRSTSALFMAELRRAASSPKLLRALRRKIAMEIHPDRRRHVTENDVADLLATYNAKIDAALAACRVSSGE